MIEHINIINALSEQISSLLDLMQMCLTMHIELMAEVEKIENEWQQSQAKEDDRK